MIGRGTIKYSSTHTYHLTQEVITMKEKNHGVHDSESTPLLGEVITLPGLKEYNSFNVIGAFIAASKAQRNLREYLNSAAELVHSIAYAIERANPSYTPSEVKQAFVADFESAIRKHISEGNLSEDWEKKQKALNQAYRKVTGTLGYGGRLATYSTCSKCEKFNAEQSEAAVKAAMDKTKMAEAAEIAVRDKITVEEALLVLDKPKLKAVENSESLPSPFQGLAEKDQSTIKQLIDDLILISNKDAVAKDRILQSLQSKVSSAKRDLGLLGPMIKAG